jgi:PAS domain S-box-containing protein
MHSVHSADLDLPAPPDEPTLARMRILVLVCGAAAVLVGATALAGWATGNELLRGFVSGVTVKTNTAIAILLCGVALLLLAPERPPRWQSALARFLAVVVALIGLATLAEHLLGWDFGIDQALFRELPGSAATTSPNRMGPPATICFPLLGAAIFLLGGSDPKSHARAQRLALPAMLVSLFSILGYIFGVGALYGLARYTGIAVNTAGSFLVLGAGVLAARPSAGFMRHAVSSDSGGAIIRRLLPACIVVPIVLGWIRVAGESAGLYDASFGRSMLILGFILVFTSITWWTGRVIGRQSRHRLALAAEGKASAERYRTLASATPALVWAADPEGRPTFVNDRWSEYTGATLEDLAGGGWDAFSHPDERSLLAGAWERGRMRGAPFEVEFRYRRRDGIYRWFLGRTVPMVDPTGAVVQWLGVSFDITERKEAEDALRRADRLKDQFLATLAHEMRNPLAPIRNAVEILKSKASPDPESVWARDVIDRQVGHMGRLLEDLLDVSRLTQNRLELRKQRIAVADVVRSGVETSRPLIESAGHRLVATLPTEELWIHADPLRISQVISNLLNNAAKYTDRGGQIRFTVEREGSDILLAVEDTGIGIEPEHLSRIFDMFSQAAPALERSQGGLGIGLALVRGIVEAHEGRIEAQSDGLGRGSRFTVRLPAARPKGTEPGPTPERQAIPRSPRAFRVLVADDNEDAASSLALLLRKAGHEVHVAHDGAEAIETADRVHPEILLLDIGMPRSHGYEVAMRLRERAWSAGAVLVAVTGWGQEEDRRNAAEAGFDHHLVKPIHLDRLDGIFRQAARREPTGNAPASETA